MKRIALGVFSVIAAASLVGSPALATKHAVRHTTSCKEIKEAVDSGKSADEVAKDMKVSAARVKSCTTPAVRHGKRGTAKPS